MKKFQSEIGLAVGQILSRNSLYNILDEIEKNVCFDSFML